MDLAFSPAEEGFRDEVRAFLTSHFPPERPWTGSDEDVSRWGDALLQRGWSVYKWPEAHGGTGWSPAEHYIWERETALAGVPALLGGIGNFMLAPMIMAWGTPEQQARHLPPIREHRIEWCQGYSEPDAGSDLAALRTRAITDGADYIVTGEKIWTSYAHKADWMFALVRTSNEGRRQAGISFLLIDMRTPGITVTPITTIDGRHTLNRVILDEVRVPQVNRLGEEGQGWTIAKGLLTHERTGLAFVADCGRLLRLLHEVLPESASRSDPLFAARMAEAEIDLMALEVTELRTLAETAAGTAPGPYSSLLKLVGSSLIQRITALLVEAGGPAAMAWSEDPDIGPPWLQEELRRYFIGRSATIAGGASEVQKDIIARHVLGL
jgi:alkylation response protein AidB-like acyl-CoA dehydrogenase